MILSDELYESAQMWRAQLRAVRESLGRELAKTIDSRRRPLMLFLYKEQAIYARLVAECERLLRNETSE
jgi:hypothetical protein